MLIPNMTLSVKRLQRCHPNCGEIHVGGGCSPWLQGKVLLHKRFGHFARNETGSSTLPTASAFPRLPNTALSTTWCTSRTQLCNTQEVQQGWGPPEQCSEPGDPRRGSWEDVTVGVPRKPPTSSGKLVAAPPQADEKVDFTQQVWGGRRASETVCFSVSRPKFSEFPFQGEFVNSWGFVLIQTETVFWNDKISCAWVALFSSSLCSKPEVSLSSNF